jgi:S-DNA-T family DNA segregation ATPase FtsK/SpoIIIE
MPSKKTEKDHRRRREIIGVILVFIALLSLLALVSYDPHDPSLHHFEIDANPVHNLVGTFGSYTSDLMFYLLGIGAFWIPILLFIATYQLFMNPSFTISPWIAGGTIGIIATTSGLCELVVKTISFSDISIPAGGQGGALLVRVLSSHLSIVGTYILLFLILTVSIMTLIDISLVRVVQGLTMFSQYIKERGSAVMTSVGTSWDEIKAQRLKKETDLPGPVIEETPAVTEKRTRRRAQQTSFDFIVPEGTFKLPPLDLLEQPEVRDTRQRKDSLIANSKILEKTLADFGVTARVAEVHPGPVITMYELEPAPGVKINKITSLSDDLALALKAPSIRIIAPIPGKAVIGIEIPNPERESVYLRDVLGHEGFLDGSFRLPIALGVDIVGSPFIADLSRMPHLLIAGTTGSGKSVSLNAMICSILFKAIPDEIKFLLIDPKRLELSAYEGLPHLIHPVVVDPKQAALVLKWAVAEMERRYQIMSELGAKSIEGYNRMVEKGRAGKKTTETIRVEAAGPEEMDIFEVSTTREASTLQSPPKSPTNPLQHKKFPYVIIIIDELADLMMVAQRNVEESLARLAQMARASGIHLILATQRPSVDVITGVIKANFPTRISFLVSSKVDSRTILDQLGAETLLGAGDMLFIPPGSSKLTRIHGAYVSDKEIARIVDFVKKQCAPAFDESIDEFEPEAPEGARGDDTVDEKYDEAVELVADLGQASISLVQRYMKIGYNRAARIIERMEAENIVGPSDGAKPRKVLIKKLPR